jgi:acylaminoacyl-peptidase
MTLKRTLIWLLFPALLAFGAGRPFAIEDVWEWRSLSDPQISADGSWVAFVEEQTDSQIRIVPTTVPTAVTVPVTEPRPRGSDPASTPRRDRSTRWSPDARRIAYLSERDGRTQIYVRLIANGEEIHLTHLDRAPIALAWSPDGASIAFTAPVASRRQPPAWVPPSLLSALRQPPDAWLQIFVVPSAGGAPRQITSGDFDHHGALAWMPDGSDLLSSWPPDPSNSLKGDEIYAIHLSDGKIRRLTEHDGPDENPVPSPDGSKIAWLAADDKLQSYKPRKLYVMNADGSRVKVLSGLLDRDVREPRWSSDSRTLYFLADDRGATHIYAARNDATLRQVTTFPSRLRGFSLSDGGRAATIRSGFTTPAAVVTLAVDVPSEVRQLAAVNTALFKDRETGSVDEVNYPSAGYNVQGWLIKPPQFDESRKYPLILDVADGPGHMYGAEFNLRAQIFAAHGYLVACINPRGSAGYGEQFGNLLPTRFPGDDYEDLMRGVDFLLTKNYVDASRILLAGGTAAAWAIGHTDRFAAAVVRRPVVDWTADVTLRPDGARRAAMWLRALPWENPEQYTQRSPLFFAQNFKTPALVLAGDQDPESEQLYFALQSRKIDSALLRLPETGKPSDEIAELEATLAWFSR